jgi:hypothetical protein
MCGRVLVILACTGTKASGFEEMMRGLLEDSAKTWWITTCEPKSVVDSQPLWSQKTNHKKARLQTNTHKKKEKGGNERNTLRGSENGKSIIIGKQAWSQH